ncbi:equilibrative nucleoside transporter-like protein [Dermatophagoides farinae]|uniref:Equilibrative nucleoside transporter-like protein n=1 Tax=Dermatophagoides farinae TaxID=6954 RepID=A0A9D4SG73_DERFA|nr:equilibrative nucleoside transporter-like protein [Dermatophagoides farinae]
MVRSSEIMANVPIDRMKIIFIIFFINGIGTLLPWNMLINADKYFVSYKLNVTDSTPTIDNYRNSFLSYLGIASKAPNILLQLINMFISTQGSVNLGYRITYSLVAQILVFIFIIAMAIVDSSGWPSIFFWLTMLSAVAINLANGIYQSCAYGLAARFPMKYTNSVVMGMNVSGTIAAILMIISIALSPKENLEALIFFSCAVIILFICFIGQFYVNKNEFYRFFATPSMLNSNLNLIKSINACPSCFEKGHSKTSNNNCPHLSRSLERAVSYDGKSFHDKQPLIESKTQQYLQVFRSIWMLLLNIILIYVVSLSLFPTVHARIIPKDNIISSAYFSPVFCFLSFNLFATVGNLIAQYVQWPGPRYLIIFSLIRLFLHRSLPVIFNNDWMYIVGSITMAISSGYLSSLCMMYAPKCVPSHLATSSGQMAALTILLGILIGINISLIYPCLVR